MRGVIAGVLTLIVLQAVTANDHALTQTGGLLNWAAAGVKHALSPTVAAIPTRKGTGKTSNNPPKQSTPTPAGGIVLPAVSSPSIVNV